jgi:hypothetical protein
MPENPDLLGLFKLNRAAAARDRRAAARKRYNEATAEMITALRDVGVDASAILKLTDAAHELGASMDAVADQGNAEMDDAAQHLRAKLDHVRAEVMARWAKDAAERLYILMSRTFLAGVATVIVVYWSFSLGGGQHAVTPRCEDIRGGTRCEFWAKPPVDMPTRP